MNRKSFLKNSILGAAGVAATKTIKADAKHNISTYDKLIDQVGFNHLPNTENKTMKSVLHKASSRGNANHGWLNSYHTFSFANYYNPERMNFGVLRVLNDDVVAAGRGFGKHPHDNMEIISIPIEGDLEHQDSMGNVTVIKQGDIQVMSAGTGVFHSEVNKNKDRQVKFLQIWMFPNKKDVTPRYDQITLNPSDTKNKFAQILSPSKNDAGVWVHQNAWFSLGDFETEKQQEYIIKKEGNGVYVFVLEGEINVDGQALNKRDGYGLWDVSKINITCKSKSKVLIMDVPMSV